MLLPFNVPSGPILLLLTALTGMASTATAFVAVRPVFLGPSSSSSTPMTTRTTTRWTTVFTIGKTKIGAAPVPAVAAAKEAVDDDCPAFDTSAKNEIINNCVVPTTLTKTTTTTTSRRELCRSVLAAASVSSAVAASCPLGVAAFEGSGSSAYSGRSPQSKLELRKRYQIRVAADVRDFNTLGRAIKDDGKTDGDEWTFFFIQYARKSPDEAGRSYAALADFIGHRGEGGKLEGGDGYLLAASFAKQGKPPDNTPAVKAYNKLSTAFEPIRVAGAKGDINKAKTEWDKAGVLFSQYLEEVDMPSSLSDPLYN